MVEILEVEGHSKTLFLQKRILGHRGVLLASYRVTSVELIALPSPRLFDPLSFKFRRRVFI